LNINLRYTCNGDNTVHIHKFGSGPQDLVYEEDVMLPPHPTEGEVLIRVYATGVTRNEIVWIWHNPDISFPIILGHEIAGVVGEDGPKVTNQKVSEAVYRLTDTCEIL
jgi:NADPH:quinone reductase-like Zn-dependent oxidoreductase